MSCDLLKKHNYQLGMKQPNNPKLICHTVIPQKIPKDPLKAMDLCVFFYTFLPCPKTEHVEHWELNKPAGTKILTYPYMPQIHRNPYIVSSLNQPPNLRGDIGRQHSDLHRMHHVTQKPEGQARSNKKGLCGAVLLSR